MMDNREKLKALRKKDPQQARRLLRKEKRKKSKRRARVQSVAKGAEKEQLLDSEGLLLIGQNDEEPHSGDEDEVEYIVESFEDQMSKMGPEANALHGDEEFFKGVFDRFQKSEELEDEEYDEEEDELAMRLLEGTMSRTPDDDDDEMGNQKNSTKLKRRMARPSIAALKQICHRPDLVEVWDANSPDPRLLVWLKAYRNSVSMPQHWSQKRKYLQGKKGIDKPPFKLPEFIEATKISEIRAAIQEKDAMKTLKQKMREKVRPKTHKMDIDYQVLHDAFFKYASKPKMTRHGEVYHEGKEFESKMKQFRPGVLSPRLREALGMFSDSSPPPWLLNMQRYGPPPSYPSLPIPGLNAPVPPGAEFGYHVGGWGQPPVDQYGMALYGNVHEAPLVLAEQASKLWGELEDEPEEEESDTEEMEDMTDTEKSQSGMETPLSVAGSVTPFDGMESVSGLQSVQSVATLGLETPQSVDLRRKGISTATPKPYTILREQKAPPQQRAIFQSSTIYKMPSSSANVHGTTSVIPGNITPMNLAPGGLVTPFLGGTMTPLGMSAGGAVTPITGGIQTPSGAPGVTVSINPSDIEQEGAFAADVIRQQLKQHEATRVQTLKAAGQTDGTMTAESTTSTAAPARPAKESKKKKKGFKF